MLISPTSKDCIDKGLLSIENKKPNKNNIFKLKNLINTLFC
tara:strand:- start:2670 stop:2792 length:123 start_codon:yes stop_codon:yes gene_type:complete